MGDSPTAPLVVTTLILILGIIHLAVGIGIATRYRQYRDVFQQSVGLYSFNIVIGVYAIAVGIIGLVAILQKRAALSKTIAIVSAILGVFALASLISAMIVSTQAISYVRGRLAYHITAYVEDQNSINIMDAVQTKFQCCGENLWLDWGRSQLGSTATTGSSGGTGVGTGTGSGTGTGVGTGTGTNISIALGMNTNMSIGTGINMMGDKNITNSELGDNSRKFLLFLIGSRRRRGHLHLYSSTLVKSIHKRQQLITGVTLNGLPSGYSINLPLSCCKQNGVGSANSLGGYCVATVNNSSNSFYVTGCMIPCANIVVTQAAGLVLINTCLAILAFVFLVLAMHMFPDTFNPNNPNTKQPLPNEMRQEQQTQNEGYYYSNDNSNAGYYANNNNPNAYYPYILPQHVVYQ
ncbi:unnamed protein product [Rotaria sp. Silwood2]|nr:unnamed protein product [Rotaria sp. Silwood2]